MAKNSKMTPLARSLNAELQAGSNTTQGMSMKSPDELQQNINSRLNTGALNDTNSQFDWMALGHESNPTIGFNKGKTAAYPVSKTQALTSQTFASSGGRSTEETGNTLEDSPAANKNQATGQHSPVRMKGDRGNSRGQASKSPSLLHSTMRAMELLGEHEGNNKRIVESLVNQ
jgi:hypothetical protein